MAETGKYYDRHPVTGEPGRWRLFPNIGTYVNVDPNAPKDVYWNERGQNYMGNLGQYYTVNPNTGEESIVTNPETGETRGGWYYSGTLGWLNTKPAEVQPDPGSISFGDYGGALAGPTRSAEAPKQPEGTDSTTGTEQPLMGSTGTGSISGSSSGGAFSSMAPSGLSYQPTQLPSMPSASPKVDFVKLLNGMLAANVVGGMMTGRKV